MTKTRWIGRTTMAVLVMLVAGGIAWGTFLHGSRGGRDSQPEETVAVSRVLRNDLSQTVAVTGEMRPNQQIDVHAKVAGYLKSINVDIGDHVRQGDVLAILEVPELDEDVQSARAGTAAAREQVKGAQAKYEEAHVAFQRLQEVAKKNPKLIARQDLDSASSRDAAAAADLALAEQHVEECKANQNRVETMMDYATITAPFSGVITRRYADPGALIQAGISSNTQAMPVVSLAEDSMLRATFPLPESIVDRMQTGDRVDIRIPALNQTIKSRVSRYSRQIDRATRTMQVQIDVPNPQGSITPGMYAIADIAIESRKDVISVPVQAVKGSEEPVVFVVTDKGLVERRPVTLGMQTPDEVEIRSGVSQGEFVVVGNTGELRNGMKVRAKETNVAGASVHKDSARS